MKITKKTEYAIRAILLLSINKDKGVTLTREVAKKMDIPEQFLAQVMIVLGKEGLVRAIRGAKGGFVLAKDPSEISLKDVIEAIEGKIVINDCINYGVCDSANACPIHLVWEKANESLNKIFEEINFSTLTEKLKNNLLKTKENKYFKITGSITDNILSNIS